MLIWLTEVARSRRQHANLWRAINVANAEANPELFRIALKMATGAGKTTVMAMLIAWQTLNAVRMPGSDRFSRAFLIVTPGITIRDRLQVLYPEHPRATTGRASCCPTTCLAISARQPSSLPTTTPFSIARPSRCLGSDAPS
jgi:type III restriction enzyme